MSARLKRVHEVDLGNLSPEEERYITRPVELSLRVGLEHQQTENEDLRDQFAARIKEILPPTLPWEFIEQYADCVARAYYYRRKREDMGFLK